VDNQVTTRPTVTPCYAMTTATSTPRFTAPLARPVLVPGLRRLWRGRHRLQLGVDPSRAIVLELPGPAAARVLDLLDGTRSERQVLAAARGYGVTDRVARAMIDSLRAAGLVMGAHTLLPQTFPDPVRRRLAAEAAALALRAPDVTATPAQVLRNRAAARVLITGGGRLAGAIAVALAQAGVGHVAPLLENPADAREVAATINRLAPGARTAVLQRRDATFVVAGGRIGPAGLAAARYHRVAHLSVTMRDGTAVIGPLVPPRGTPCLNCLDLHRQDRDPGWAGLAAQLEKAPAVEPGTAATVLTAAGIAASDVLCWLDRTDPSTLGGCVEITPDGQLRRRRWPPHPACHCTRPARRRHAPHADRPRSGHDPAPRPAPRPAPGDRPHR
jgi:bacteriocin biosynthesis cyclodehydratase domain-containing protein